MSTLNDGDRVALANVRKELDEEAHHQRRLQLMRMQGDINRQERRADLLKVLAAVLLVAAIICSTLPWAD